MRDTRVLEEIYVMLMQRNEETRIAEAMQTASVQVVDYAVEPKSPIKPRIKLNMPSRRVGNLYWRRFGVLVGVCRQHDQDKGRSGNPSRAASLGSDSRLNPCCPKLRQATRPSRVRM